MLVKKIIEEFKKFYSINVTNKRRFSQSVVMSSVSKNTIIGNNATIKTNVLMNPTLRSIGEGTYIGDYTSIFNCSSIGSYCSISHGVKLGLDNHPTSGISTNTKLFWNKNSLSVGQQPTVIESDVLISANAMIMSGVKIGTGSIIGAGSFVNNDVPPYAIVVGSPARIIKYRFNEEIIEKLILSKWWLMPLEELRQLEKNLDDPVEFLKGINQIKR